jgi:hypothetical protein
MSITHPRITGTLLQFVGNELPLRPRRRQLIDEAIDLGGKFGVALGEENLARYPPAAFDFRSSLDQRRLAGLDLESATEEFGRDGFGLCADVGRIAA